MKDHKFLESIQIIFGKECKPNSQGEVLVRCLNHEDDHASCHVNAHTGLFNCKACGFSGNFAQLLSKYETELQKQKLYVKDRIDSAKELAGLDDERQTFLSYRSEDTDLTYVIEGQPREINGIKAMVQVISNLTPFYKDAVNLSLQKSRASFSNKLHFHSGADALLIEKDLLEIEQQCSVKLNELDVNEEPEEKFSEKLLNDAKVILKNSKLIKIIKEHLRIVGLIGEAFNGLMLYLACTSRKLADPISVVVKGESSGGKSYLAGKIVALFPKSEVLEFTYMSAKSFMHMSRNLSHKIIVIAEKHGSEASDYSIRSLQSEGVIRIAVVEKNEKSGKNQTVEKEVKGPVAFIVTTTSLFIHPENETRVFTIFINDSSNQTKKIHSFQKADYTIESLNSQASIEHITKMHHAIQSLLKNYKVIIPFVNEMEFPFNKTRYRRDHKRFLKLIEVSAILHQFQRKIEKVYDREVLYAQVEDYVLAYEIVVKSFGANLLSLPPKSQRLLRFCKKLSENFTRKDMVEITKWPLDDVKKYSWPLVKEGYLERLKGSQGSRYWYKIIKDYQVDILTPEQLEKKLNKKCSKKKVLRLVKKVSKKLDSN